MHKDSHTKPLHDATALMAVDAQMQRHKWLSMQDAAILMADEARMQNHTSTHRRSPYEK